MHAIIFPCLNKYSFIFSQKKLKRSGTINKSLATNETVNRTPVVLCQHINLKELIVALEKRNRSDVPIPNDGVSELICGIRMLEICIFSGLRFQPQVLSNQRKTESKRKERKRHTLASTQSSFSSAWRDCQGHRVRQMSTRCSSSHLYFHSHAHALQH